MTDTEVIRHTIATIAYRAAKTLRDAPDSFADFLPGPTSNKPVTIVAHLADLTEWAVTMAQGAPRWQSGPPASMEEERDRFYTALKRLDEVLVSATLSDDIMRKLIQGPIADALTHVGQLAMIRRLRGSPMKGENYSKAPVEIGRVGFDQPKTDPRNEFD